MKNGNRYEVGLLWKNEETKLPYNRDLAVNRFKSTENKFNKNPEIVTKYKETVNSYIESGYARKLSKEEADSTSNITNYMPHQSVVNHLYNLGKERLLQRQIFSKCSIE